MMTTWRLCYELTPNDARYLEITEEEVAFDLLVRHFHQTMREENDPGLKYIEELQEEGEEALRDLERKTKVLVKSAKEQRALQRAIKGGTDEERAEKSRPKEIRIGGTATTTTGKPRKKTKKVKP